MRGNRASGEFLLTAFETSGRGTAILSKRTFDLYGDSFHIRPRNVGVKFKQGIGEFIACVSTYFRLDKKLLNFDFIGTCNRSILIASVSI